MFYLNTPKYCSFIGVERWASVKGYEKLYHVSNLGKIKSLARKVNTNNKINLNEIAKNYNVSWYTIYDIKNRRTWKHI